MKVFHELSNIEQQNIRRQYKLERYNDYRYSIRLYIMYVILGIFSIFGIFIYFSLGKIIGLVILNIGMLLMIINIIFLYKSNIKFKEFLKENGYLYDKK